MRCFNVTSQPRTRVAGLLMLALAGHGLQAQAEVKLSLAVPPAGAAVSAQASTASAPSQGALVVTVDGLSAKEQAESGPAYLSKAADETRAAPAPLDIAFVNPPMALQASGAQRSWVLPYTINKVPPAMDQTRYLRLTMPDGDRLLPYRLTSPAVPPSTWVVKPAPAGERAISPDEGLAIDISVTGAQRISGFKLGRVDLLEQGLKNVLGGGQLALCATPKPCAPQAHELAGNGLTTLWLMPAAAAASKPMPGGEAMDERDRRAGAKALAWLWPGKYVGAVTVASSDKPGGESVSLTVHVTSWFWRGLGVGVILIGVGLAWWATVFLRNRLNRNQLLLPAVALREAGARAQAQVEALRLPAEATRVKTLLTAIGKELSDDQLQLNGLPTLWTLPGAPPINDTKINELRQYLGKVGLWLSACQAIITTGLVPLEAKRPAQTLKGPAHVAALDQALIQVDQLAQLANAHQALTTNPAPTPEALAQQITAANTALQARLDGLDLAAGVQPSPDRKNSVSDARHQPTVDSLRLQIANDTYAAWSFILLVTVLAGSYMLVFKNTGFGTALDLLEALLWGLGLPAAAQLTAGTTTTSTIASTFSVVR